MRIKETIMINHFRIGDIIQGSNDESYHPIIYFGEKDLNYFIGGMITHSGGYGNIKLEDIHFNNKIDSNPNPSYFVRNYLLKKEDYN